MGMYTGRTTAIADASGLSKSYVIKVLKGLREPKLLAAKRIAAAARVSLDMFYIEWQKVRQNALLHRRSSTNKKAA